MKKKAYITIVLVFVLSLFLSSTLFAFDSFVGPTAKSDGLYLDNLMSFFDELSETVFEDPENPEDPEDNTGGKGGETESYRRGHRIRKPTSEINDKKKVKIDS